MARLRREVEEQRPSSSQRRASEVRFHRAEGGRLPVSTMCRILSGGKSSFYAWTKRPKPARAKRDAQLAATVAGVHQCSRRTQGSPRVHEELRARGVSVGRKRIERLMRENGPQGRRKRCFKRTTDSRRGGPIARNVIACDFSMNEPNRAWVTDVTAIATGEGWLYLAPMLDLHSRRVVAWAVSERNDTTLALDVLRTAIRAREPSPGLLHHSDRGSPHASDDYRAELRAHGVRRSKSRKGDCWDNAVAESFFATLRAELVDHERYPTRAAAMKSIGDYIDNFYNVERRHSHLGYLNPIEFEMRSELQQRLA
jgi:putative transposase